jgi:predicted glycosyltransferase involved in capsule biosynthesis
MKSASVITLVRGREQHLKNMILGLLESTQLPSELVIVHMNEAADYPLPETSFPVHRVLVTSSVSIIPLAAARNRGAEAAHEELLIFLDVDCIPESTLVSDYLQAQSEFNGLLMGDIRYLPPRVTTKNWTMEELRKKGVPHPKRPTVKNLVEPSNGYELFWSLTFAISKAGFKQIGGFDTRYQGYGAEDTDFAFTARELDIPFALNRSICYHQHHPVYRPPLQHFNDIIANARRFYTKWDHWAMEGWLEEFAARGYIDYKPTDSEIQIIRQPTEAEVQAAYYEAPAGF